MDKKITHLLIDTSYLCKVGFGDPDFRKLLRHSKANALKIYIPFIVWEERRTQLLPRTHNALDRLSEASETLNAQLSNNFILKGLPPPALSIWTKAEIESRSKETMGAFAEENKIEIIPIAQDHADRAWRRYFDIDPPFNPEQKREERRKDIPDSWILEAAIDIKEKSSGLMALCDDGRLSDALKKNGVRVFKNTQEFLDVIEKSLIPEAELIAAEAQEAMPSTGKDIAADTVNRLEMVLAGAQETFKDIDTKVLGYIGYLGTPSKDQLFNLLTQSGISSEIVMNVTERLVIAGVIKDTGNHYLLANKEIGDLAATSVEAEIINLLER